MCTRSFVIYSVARSLETTLKKVGLLRYSQSREDICILTLGTLPYMQLKNTAGGVMSEPPQLTPFDVKEQQLYFGYLW